MADTRHGSSLTDAGSCRGTMTGITLKQKWTKTGLFTHQQGTCAGFRLLRDRLVLLYPWLSHCNSNPTQYKNCRFGHLVYPLVWGIGGVRLPYLGLCLNASGHILSGQSHDKLQYFRQTRGSKQIDWSSLDRPSPLQGVGGQTIVHVRQARWTSTAAGLHTWLSSHPQWSTKHTCNWSQDSESSADSKTRQERCRTQYRICQNVIWWDSSPHLEDSS